MKQHLVNESLDFFEQFAEENEDNDWYMESKLWVAQYIKWLEKNIKQGTSDRLNGLTTEEIRDLWEQEFFDNLCCCLEDPCICEEEDRAIIGDEIN